MAGQELTKLRKMIEKQKDAWHGFARSFLNISDEELIRRVSAMTARQQEKDQGEPSRLDKAWIIAEVVGQHSGRTLDQPEAMELSQQAAVFGSFRDAEEELPSCSSGGEWWPGRGVKNSPVRGAAVERCFSYKEHWMPRMACSETEAEVIKTNQAVFQDLEDCADCLFAVGSSLYRFEIYQTLGVYRFSVFWYFEASLQSFGGVEVTGYGNLSDC